jgi:hypothetical protein
MCAAITVNHVWRGTGTLAAQKPQKKPILLVIVLPA